MANKSQARAEQTSLPKANRPAFMDKPTGPTLEQRLEALETALNKYSGQEIATALAVIVKRDADIERARTEADDRPVEGVGA